MFLGIIISCKTVKPAETPAESEIKPEAILMFESVEAETPENLYLNFRLDLSNTNNDDAELLFQNPSLTINGTPIDESLFSLELPMVKRAANQKQNTFPLRILFHASEYEKTCQADFDEYKIDVTLPIQLIFPDRTMDILVEAPAIFPRVREPDFAIAMIEIVQAELINTRLKVSIQVDNPNHFPVELTSFDYELYGDGRFWAKGEETEVLMIPAKDSAGIDLFLTMNFTNMRRNVLDQVIKMTEVRYRFKGNAGVETGSEYLPRFVMDFEHEGHSAVIR
jgi:LEA14-like dessication related protein